MDTNEQVLNTVRAIDGIAYLPVQTCINSIAVNDDEADALKSIYADVLYHPFRWWVRLDITQKERVADWINKNQKNWEKWSKS